MSEADRRLAETAARYDSEPEATQGGHAQELTARAERAEHKRDIAHGAAIITTRSASAAFQIGIVLARRRSSPA